MRRNCLSLIVLTLVLLLLSACGRDDSRSDGDHMSQPGRMNHDRPDSSPSK